MSPRRPLLVAALATAGLLASATAASAHPFIADGASAPANSLATLELNLAHGCGDEAGGEGDPTTEVAIEVPDFVSYLEPADTDGYEVSVEGDAGAVPDVVVWTATDGGVPAPVLPMDVVIDGAEGDELFLPVFQACDDFEYRWIGTPDDPADDPAIGLTLTAEDPDSPPPAVEEPADEPADDPADVPGADPTEPPAEPTDEPADGADAEAPDGDVMPEPTDEPTDEAAGADEPATDDAVASEEAAGSEGGGSTLPIVLVVAVLAAIAAGVALSRRKGGPSDGAGSGTAA